MKDVMISIRPKWCELEATGEKTIEARKSRPNIETPFKCFIYCTKSKHDLDYLLHWTWKSGTTEIERGAYTAVKNCKIFNGKVIGEFVCDKIYTRLANTLYLSSAQIDYLGLLKEACLSEMEVLNYCGGSYDKDLYFWHISDLKIYDKPKELSEFDYYNKCVSDCENVDCCKTNAIANECEGYTPCAITRPPQSWCYCEELEENENE